ncbi:NAD-dependent epimerase/dehydratase family protein [Herbiconiux liukaitaii]|uniref:NAD-dependent epimerase/dehydratase family protein n=1 Tax=Herbiconiux liukaitaii TaxID=3342799 RepID=UPI0035BAADE0
MKALVTGAAGFVGSNLSGRLLADGHDVVGIDIVTDYYDPTIKEGNLEKLHGEPNFTFLREDLNEADLDTILDGVDVVFHQAGQPGVRSSWGHEFDLYTRANIGATQRLLEAAVRNGSLSRFVYASSSSIYGNAESFPTREDARPQPVSPYGVTKLAAEHLCSLYAQNFNLPTVSLRYFTVYGPGQRPDMAFTRFCKAAVTDGTITIYGQGKQIRDFTFIDDVVEANVRAGTRSVAPGTVLNVAGGSNISVNEVLETIEGIHGAPLRIEYLDGVKGDVFRTGGDTTQIQENLDWSPAVSLVDGLRSQYDWAKRVFGAHGGA